LFDVDKDLWFSLTKRLLLQVDFPNLACRWKSLHEESFVASGAWSFGSSNVRSGDNSSLMFQLSLRRVLYNDSVDLSERSLVNEFNKFPGESVDE
jgi:hypothetical protein